MRTDRADEDRTTWMVLRCAGCDTLRLTRELSGGKLGEFQAWTPVIKQKVRKPRSSRFELREVAALPSFIFIPERQAPYLPAIPTRPYSLMHFGDRLVRIADRQLEPLRNIDDPTQVPIELSFEVGDTVRIITGAFQGLTAHVDKITRTQATVTIDGFQQRVKLPPSICQEIC